MVFGEAKSEDSTFQAMQQVATSQQASHQAPAAAAAPRLLSVSDSRYLAIASLATMVPEYHLQCHALCCLCCLRVDLGADLCSKCDWGPPELWFPFELLKNAYQGTGMY